VHGIELTGLTPAVAEAADYLERLAVKDVDPFVGAIGKSSFGCSRVSTAAARGANVVGGRCGRLVTR